MFLTLLIWSVSVQLSPEAKAKKIREIAYQLKEESKY